MTDLVESTDISFSPPTTAPVSDAARQRVDALRRSRTGTGESGRRRRHPAQTARIAAAGLGVASLFALVGAMGYSDRSAATAVEPLVQPVVSAAPLPHIVVVIHQTPTATAADAATASAGGAAQPAAQPAIVAAPTTAAPPIALTATPVVRQAPTVKAPAAAAPTAAKTHGSR